MNKSVRINRKSSIRTEFYDTGELKATYCVDGEGAKNNEETVYYRSGSINKIKNWKNGKLHGEAAVFYKTGEKYIISRYVNDCLDGEFIVFNKNGTIRESYIYRNGEIVS
jgi:antitoxin component YwqK of YwqJK toxin-antitoxin module